MGKPTLLMLSTKLDLVHDEAQARHSLEQLLKFIKSMLTVHKLVLEQHAPCIQAKYKSNLATDLGST